MADATINSVPFVLEIYNDPGARPPRKLKRQTSDRADADVQGTAEHRSFFKPATGSKPKCARRVYDELLGLVSHLCSGPPCSTNLPVQTVPIPQTLTSDYNLFATGNLRSTRTLFVRTEFNSRLNASVL
ncbi:hypothetical protein K0M31_000700, partial [Melipona bicolor]